MTDNPYAAPAASMEPASSPEAFQLREPRGVSAGRGVAWISEGFAHFKQDPGQWILVCIVGFVLMIVLSIVPLINTISTLLTYVWIGGLMLGCRAQDEGKPMTLSYLFAGFQQKFGSLLLLGLIVTIAGVVLALVALGPMFSQMFSAAMSANPEANQEFIDNFSMSNVLLPVLIAMLFFIPLLMAIYFAPMLIVLNDVPVGRAMSLSFKGCLKNIVPFLIYGIVFFILYILAAIPLLLGLLVLMPTAFGSMYRAYKDIYIES
ncbi:BPSS1780 family membrane protein [Gilvimarinus sp. F26214L]|uniref:BPSS1780 family membrane protein n=1 Tax=Gilvimarinus sp. DZF01 TaxID=3461371 RepID=UPI004045301D